MSVDDEDDTNDTRETPPSWPAPPPPAASPRPPKLHEGKTDPAIRIIRPWMEEALKRHDNKLTLRSVLVAAAAVATSVIAGIIFIDNRVSAQTDAGMRATAAELKGQDARVTTLEKRFDRFEERTDKQMNLLLDAARVPEMKRPPRLDAGND